MTRVLELHGVFLGELGDCPHSRAFDLAGFTGSVGQSIALTDSADPAVFVGLGERGKTSPATVVQALHSIATFNLADFEISLDSLKTSIDDSIPGVDAVSFLATRLIAEHQNLTLTLAGQVLATGENQALATSIQLAQAITNASGSSMNPPAFADLVTDLCKDPRLNVTILSGQQLLDEGFPAISAMGAGSPYPPQLIRIDYLSTSPMAPIVLVGKGVTFDTGGLSLKSPAAMAGMRHDICGAATILSAMCSLPKINYSNSVTAILPVIENMVGPYSIRPGDDINTRKGVSVRVLDTDFEGRVILADALTLASELEPRVIVDFATLTYQSVIALGPEIAAFFCNNDDLAHRIDRSAFSSGERFWRLPLDHVYDSHIRTSVGLKNHPETDSGRAITAALFLNQFVSPEIPWVHIDATGPTWTGPAGADGATGFGVATIVQLLRDLETDH